VAGHGLHGRGRDLLDLERDHRAPARQVGRRVAVVERRRDHARGERARGAVRVGVEHVHVVPHRPRGHRGHAPELAAAEEADRGAREHRAGGVDVRHAPNAPRGRRRRERLREHLVAPRVAAGLQAGAERGVGGGHHLRGEQARVGRARLADRRASPPERRPASARSRAASPRR
jgi:hypothetical protein